MVGWSNDPNKYHNRITNLLRQKVKPLLGKLFVLSCTVVMVSVASANPQLNSVTSGKVTVSQSGTTTTINQSTQHAIIQWNSFNIRKKELTQFIQPNSNSFALNRIDPTQGASQIFGTLTSNGKIILINAAGIHFGAGSMINVGGLIASTTNISDANFLAGNFVFDEPSAYSGASITNKGTIVANDYGLIALLGTHVVNHGLLQAELGSVVLGAGGTFTLDFYGDQLINFAVNSGATNAHIKNTGTILADGGKILVTAQAAQGVLDNVIDMEGVAQAQAVSQQNGEIILSGGNNGRVVLAGKLDASGKQSGQTGGTVKVLGNDIELASTSNINASGDAGGGIIDVGGDLHGTGADQNAQTTAVRNGSVLDASAIKNGNGGNVVVWSNDNTEFGGSILAEGGAQSGNGGYVETSGAYLGLANGKVNTLAPHGSIGTWLLDPSNVTISTAADSGYASVSGTYAPNPGYGSDTVNTTTLDNALASSNIIVTTTNATNCCTGSGGSAGTIVVANPIAWSAATTLTLSAATTITINASITAVAGGLTLIAANTPQSITTGASGTINVGAFTLTQGEWYQVSSTLPAFYAGTFSLNTGATTFNSQFGGEFTRATSVSGSTYNIADIYGLQGVATMPLTNNYNLVNNIDASVTSAWSGGFQSIGVATAYTGTFNGQGYTITNLYSAPGYTYGVSFFSNVGSGGTVKYTGLVNPTINGFQNVGGFVAANSGTMLGDFVSGGSISGSNYTGGFASGNYGGGTITQSYATDTVNDGGGNYIGGFAGINYGTISNSYSGGVMNVSNSNGLGGFVGVQDGAVNNSYSTEVMHLSNNANVVGFAYGSTTNDYWDVSVSGLVSGYGTSGGVTGLTDNQMMNGAYLSGLNYFDPTQSATANNTAGNVWIMAGYPHLTMENPGFLSSNTGPAIAISNVVQLQLIEANPLAAYYITNNIDASSTASWNGGAGFLPIGNSSIPFYGALSGQNNAIINLTINRPTSTAVGLIGVSNMGYIYNDANLNNLGLVNPSIVGTGYVGGFIGQAIGSYNNLYNDYVSGGTITAVGPSYVGGIIGSGGATISTSYNSAAVTGTNSNVGGIVGQINSGWTAYNSYNLGTVTGIGTGSNVGGFVGVNFGTVQNSYSSGLVLGNGVIGGFAGSSQSGTFLNDFWNTTTSGLTTSAGSTGVAGYMGMTTAQMQVQANFTTTGNGFVTTANGATVWSFGSTPGIGLWYDAMGTMPILQMEYGNTSGTVTVNTAHQLEMINENLGGTYVQGANIDLTSTGNGSDVWGSAGFVPIALTSTFTGSYNGSSYIINNLFINQPNTTSNTGLFAYSTGALSNISLTNVNVTGGNWTGGILGNMGGGTLTNSYVSGQVTGNYSNGGGGGYGIGGIVGEVHGGTISNSYSLANVSTSTNNESIGSFVGYSSGTISNSYSTGSVTLVGGGSGGAFGNGGGTFTNDYYDTSTSNTSGGAGTGETTAWLSNPANLSTFNFTSTWYSNGTLPILRMEASTNIVNAHQLELIGANPSGSYILDSNINASNTTTASDVWGGLGFAPIGNLTNFFTGSLNGNGHTINNLSNYINTATQAYGDVGMIANNAGLIENVGLSNFSGTVNLSFGLSGGSTGGIANYGALVGYNQGTMLNDYVTGAVGVTSTVSSRSGALVGASSGLVMNSYSTAALTVNDTGAYAVEGDLIGWNFGSGVLTQSYATGNVNVTMGSSNSLGYIGGLAGENQSVISNSFAMGSITTAGHSSDIGGLVGSNDYSAAAQISVSYSIGFISGYSGSVVGGLVGTDTSGSGVTNSYFDTSTSGTSTGIGAGTTTGTTGLNDIQMMNASNFTNLNFYNVNNSAVANSGNNWVMAGYPQLTMEATSNITNVVQLQLIELNPAGNYTLANNINASATINWNGGTGFNPIGTTSSYFTGNLSGTIAGTSNGAYVITNLFINAPNLANRFNWSGKQRQYFKRGIGKRCDEWTRWHGR
jgi:filamentous hemagglutinin family protein